MSKIKKDSSKLHHSGSWKEKLSWDAFGFLASAAVGFFIDFLMYFALIAIGLKPGLSNATSSGFSVLVMYLLVTHKVFKLTPGKASFILFVSWYFLSITFFSIFIDFLHVSLGVESVVCKLLVIPLSFLANFAVVRKLMVRARSKL